MPFGLPPTALPPVTLAESVSDCPRLMVVLVGAVVMEVGAREAKKHSSVVASLLAV